MVQLLRTLPRLLCTCGLAAAAMPALAATTLVQDVRVFDGEKMHEHRSVLIDGARIADDHFKGKAPAGATVVNGKGRTLLPGLIDAHVHAYRYQELPLLFGVTTQVDMFTGVQVMQDVTARMQRGDNSTQADLYSAGTLATVPGGHGTEYGMPIPTLTKPEEAQAWVDARLAEGSYFIKIVMEPGYPGHPMPSLEVATVQALITAAHARGKQAVVHISNLADARSALEAGADGLVHLFSGKDIAAGDLASLVQLAKARKAFVIPTFSVLESIAGVRSDDILGDAAFQSLLDKGQKQQLTALYGKQPRPEILAAPQAVTAALLKAGVPLLAGTDAGNGGTQYGVSLHHEMLALTRAGLTPLQALAAATSVPAQAFKLPQRGRIAKGYKADLLLVEGNPAHEIAATRNIVDVWKDGVSVTPLRARQLAVVAREALPSAGLALPADGRISLFGKDKMASPFGVGWMPSHDAFLGGKSSVNLKVLEAEGNSAANAAGNAEAVVQVDANVAPGFAFPWAGLAFMPGRQPMQAANLSSAKRIAFRVRGDGQQYNVSVMSGSATIPASLPFAADGEWREVSMALADFKGVDASAISMIGFYAGPKVGAYHFEISDVRLLSQ